VHWSFDLFFFFLLLIFFPFLNRLCFLVLCLLAPTSPQPLNDEGGKDNQASVSCHEHLELCHSFFFFFFIFFLAFRRCQGGHQNHQLNGTDRYISLPLWIIL